MQSTPNTAARRRMIEQWQRSGLPAHLFVLSRGFSVSTLYKRRRELQAAPGFTEVVMRDDPPHVPLPDTFVCAIEIATPRGLVVRVARDADEALLRRVLNLVVEGGASC